MELSDRAVDRTSRATGLLRAWGRGDLQARNELLPLVYRELPAAAPDAPSVTKQDKVVVFNFFDELRRLAPSK